MSGTVAEASIPVYIDDDRTRWCVLRVRRERKGRPLVKRPMRDRTRGLPGCAGLAVIGLFHPMLATAQRADSIDYLSPLEAAIVREHNLARTQPAQYAAYLEETIPRYDGPRLWVAERVYRINREGASAVREAVDFLRAVEPVPPVSASRGMSLGARDHVQDQGPKGTTGHAGSDGSQAWDRVSRYGEWQVAIAENISYGYGVAREVVMQFIIDDGVADRSHRSNVFSREVRVLGVACGPHARFDTVCTITYAGGFSERR